MLIISRWLGCNLRNAAIQLNLKRYANDIPISQPRALSVALYNETFDADLRRSLRSQLPSRPQKKNILSRCGVVI